MLPHNKYYSFFTFIFGIFGEILHPQKKTLPCYTRLLMKRQRLTCFLVCTPVPATRPSFKNGERDAILKSSNAYLRT
jgi:hypothetical protein